MEVSEIVLEEIAVNPMSIEVNNEEQDGVRGESKVRYLPDDFILVEEEDQTSFGDLW